MKEIYTSPSKKRELEKGQVQIEDTLYHEKQLKETVDKIKCQGSADKGANEKHSFAQDEQKVTFLRGYSTKNQKAHFYGVFFKLLNT